jgi:imidazoleglycerol-phosphate dehydratase
MKRRAAKVARKTHEHAALEQAIEDPLRVAGGADEDEVGVAREHGDAVDAPQPGPADVATGVPFFDHMLEQLSKHGGMALEVRAKGDLEVDAHHTVEDVGIALGDALRQALSDKAGLARYGHAVVPLDEALVEAVVDLSGRPHLTWNAGLPSGKKFIGAYDVDLTRDFFQAMVNHAALCLHVNVRYGRNMHHVVEAIFKATARALRAATAAEGRGVPSTKGML